MNKFGGMIKANELRIGNYILYKEYGEGDGVIGKIKPGDFGLIWGGNDEYHPVPLTPEWLERCGFKDGKLNDFTIGYNNDDIVHSQMSVPFDGQLIKVKYLHQLQNLYFALTGEELLIKEPA